MTDSRGSLELATWAEEAGLDAFAVADHYLSGPSNGYALDQLTVLGAVAVRTTEIELSTLVSPITFRHPAVLLKSAVTLDELSGGRFTLGVGAGWMAEEHDLFGLDFPPLGERFQRTEEALTYLRAANAGEPFSGDFYQLQADPKPEPTGSNLRLVVGGGGARRTPRLAGTFADEFNASPTADGYTERVGRAKRAAEEAGRSSDELLISTAFPLVTGTEEQIDDYLTRVAAARETTMSDLKDRWSAAGIPIGPAEAIRDSLEHLAESQIDRVYFQVGRMDVEDAKSKVGAILDAM